MQAVSRGDEVIAHGAALEMRSQCPCPFGAICCKQQRQRVELVPTFALRLG
ncbi:MAG: hypothetical protein ICV52_13225 [Microcoleus sp. C1-bin4]|nr:hypothetical protein [Microcoleus sp. C1-bin4]